MTSVPHAQFPTSSASIEELSASLQSTGGRNQQPPSGAIIMDHQGVILASSGDLKEVGDRVSRSLLTLLQDSNGIFVHSQLPPSSKGPSGREEVASITVAFKTYQYVISLTHDIILCVKSNIQ